MLTKECWQNKWEDKWHVKYVVRCKILLGGLRASIHFVALWLKSFLDNANPNTTNSANWFYVWVYSNLLLWDTECMQLHYCLIYLLINVCLFSALLVFNCSCSSNEPLGVFLSSSFAQACFWNQQTAHYTGISNPSKRTGNLSSQVLLLVKRRSVKCNSPCDWLHCCSSGLFTHQSVQPTRSGGWKDGWMCIRMSCLPLRTDKQAHWSAGMKKFSLYMVTLCLFLWFRYLPWVRTENEMCKCILLPVFFSFFFLSSW